MPVQKDGLVSIRNTGADRLLARALGLAVTLAVSAAAAVAAAVLLAGEPGHVRAGVAAIPALAAALSSGLLAISLRLYAEAPSGIEYTANIVMFRYRKGHFMGFSWGEISAVLPVGKVAAPRGYMLYDIRLSVLLKKDAVVKNLSQETAEQFVLAYNQNARKCTPGEARRLADDMFGIKRFGDRGS